MANINALNQCRSIGFLKIITNSLKLSFANMDTFFKCLLPPFLLQIAGIAIALAPAYLAKEIGMNGSLGLYLTLVIGGGIIGIVLFCNGFWKYILAYAATASMSETLIATKKLTDTKTHMEKIQVRAGKYVALLLLVCLFQLVLGVVSASWDKIFQNDFAEILIQILVAIPQIYIMLNLQAFVLDDCSPTQSIKESVDLIRGNFLKTLWFCFLTGILALIILAPTLIACLMAGTSVGLLSASQSLNPANSTAWIIVISALATITTIAMVPIYMLLYTQWYLKLKAERK